MNFSTLGKIGMASVIALTAAVPAFAQTGEAIAATDLNIRSGPGPKYEVVGVIPGGQAAALEGCLSEASWCKINFEGKTGWSSSDYLAVSVEEQAVALSTRPATVEVNSVTYEDAAQTQSDQNAGAAAGATIGALAAYAVGGPIGGIIAGGIVGGAAGSAAVEPTTETVTYVTTNPVETVYLDGEVVVGATVPDNVTTYEVPQEGLRYVTINGQTVVVGAQTNAIVQVIR
ncbi:MULTISPECIES: DUF1236 domain-containing protein [Roseobacteraceae]|uniref:Peptide-binding protein n=1 Tax=Pseudosulfitobacter pseudonitzschiae TaxID=1402135 RepID=A0A221JW52_9RHOB|nr:MULTISPECIES: DUF1236 domain-containing protein [Roseobacteraceae]ASM70922.1 peptide-binding protein [Pseudosulfitobacter pseudonitzschiae]